MRYRHHLSTRTSADLAPSIIHHCGLVSVTKLASAQERILKYVNYCRLSSHILIFRGYDLELINNRDIASPPFSSIMFGH